MTTSPNSQISNYINLPEVQALLQDIATPETTMQNWLARLVLLNDVPFQYLVPDTRLLPQESLRFFYLDPSWLDALMDGALSIGNHTSLEVMFTQTLAAVAKQAGATVAATIRQQLQGLEPTFPTQPNPNQLLSGILLRSEIVSDWPGLQIIPSYTDTSTPLTPLRFEKIGADLLLIIFPSIPTKVTFRQPAHALAFGVEDGDTATDYDIYLRGLGTGGFAAGAELTGTGNVITFQTTGSGFFRAGGNNVLDIKAIRNTLQTGLQTAGALAPNTNISPSDFALQVVKTPEQVTFTPPTQS